MPYNFEYCRENALQKLSEDNMNAAVSLISKNWDDWDDLRRPNLEAIQAIEKVLYPSKKSSQPDIKMTEVYEIRETYKAHLWKSWISSLDSMFDVHGKLQEDHYRAVKQKAAIVDVFKEIKFISKLETGLDNWINKGEFIAFINWKTKIKQTRIKEASLENELQKPPAKQSSASAFYTPASLKEAGNQSLLSLEGDGKPENSANICKLSEKYVVKDEVVYDGPDVTVVTPEAFVFDPAKKDNFDSCPKIYRSWATYDEISSNSLYENHSELADLVSEKRNAKQDSKGVKGDQIEILEYWGDIKLKDGFLLKNQLVTLAGRKKIIRFEQNPFIINPFIFATFLEDPETKRGISPLYVALPLNDVSASILNLQLDALKLIINKPYLAPKGALSGKITVKEGSIIEYDPALMPQQPVPLDFKDALVGWEFLTFFENKIESATGIFKHMTGDPQNSGQRTATEASGIMLGQNVRLSKEIDVLNFKVKVPIIEKVAELMANFSLDMKEIKIFKPNGDIDFVLVDEPVRKGKYDYTVGDSSAIVERKAKLKEYLDILNQFAQHPEIAPKIKWLEVMKWTFEQMGATDPNIFIADETANQPAS